MITYNVGLLLVNPDTKQSIELPLAINSFYPLTKAQLKDIACIRVSNRVDLAEYTQVVGIVEYV